LFASAPSPVQALLDRLALQVEQRAFFVCLSGGAQEVPIAPPFDAASVEGAVHGSVAYNKPPREGCDSSARDKQRPAIPQMVSAKAAVAINRNRFMEHSLPAGLQQ
jgi:hypothetical protein